MVKLSNKGSRDVMQSKFPDTVPYIVMPSPMDGHQTDPCVNNGSPQLDGKMSLSLQYNSCAKIMGPD